MKIPQHVAIILDGNGRWAKSKGLPRNAGHTAGAKNVETICEEAHKMGIKYLTLYAFSTENWSRPESEVEALMKLLENYLKNCLKTADKNNIRVRVIGEIGRLSEKFQDKIRELEEVSSVNTGLNLTIAINYGSRDEMIRAMKHMMEDHDAGKLAIEDITYIDGTVCKVKSLDNVYDALILESWDELKEDKKLGEIVVKDENFDFKLAKISKRLEHQFDLCYDEFKGIIRPCIEGNNIPAE